MTNLRFRNHCVYGVLCLFICFIPTKVRAFELGLSPNNVYGLWINIHVIYSELQLARGEARNPIYERRNLQPIAFKNKTPTDVYSKAEIVQQVLINKSILNTTSPVPRWIVDFQDLEEAKNKAVKTPSQVYVLSSQILNSLVKEYIDVTKGSQPISGYYVDNSVTGKDPSDVYGLVALLEHRINGSEGNFPLVGTSQ